ncbi:MAG: DUF4097 family beta strand repeat protein [Verrucomicrobia bacterium]|nr:DUF4097 family beta strand repeat protein [Verrucomicrobiota bacterium]
MNLRFRGISPAGCLAAVWLAGATLAFADHESNLAKTFPVSPGGKLVVRADRGTIDVTTSNVDQVAIQVWRAVKGGSKARADEVFADHDVTFTQESNTVTVNARMNESFTSSWFHHRPNLQVRYEIVIPDKFNVDLKTFGGSITVPDLTGEARGETSGGHLKFGRIDGPVWGKTFGGGITVAGATGAVEVATSGGQIELGEVGGKVSAQTFGGSITVRRAGGAVTAKTSGGRITIGEAVGSVEAKTFGGSISIRKAKASVTAETSGGGIDVGEAGGAVTAKTFGGSITASLAGQPADDCRLETSGGSIHVKLAPTVAVDLAASTSGGGVQTELPVTVQGAQGRGTLEGKINGGGKRLRLQTHGGSIYVEKL